MGFGHLLYPGYCACCELVSDSVCSACREEITSWIPTCCWRCGSGRPGSCLCAALPSAVTTVDALWTLNGPIAQIIENTKYRGELWRLYKLKREIKSWFSAIMKRHLVECSIVPVPPDRGRLRERGFHLPAILSGWASIQGRYSLDLTRLKRSPGDHSQQVGRGIIGRKSQDDLFTVNPPVSASVLLIDDVITTGATVISCAQALALGGAEQILVLSLGRTPWVGESGPSTVSSKTGMAVDPAPSQFPGA